MDPGVANGLWYQRGVLARRKPKHRDRPIPGEWVGMGRVRMQGVVTWVPPSPNQPPTGTPIRLSPGRGGSGKGGTGEEGVIWDGGATLSRADNKASP